MKTAYRIGRDFNFHLYAVLLFNFWLFRQSLVSAAIGIHCTDVKGKRFSALKEEDSARNGIAARPFRFQESLY